MLVLSRKEEEIIKIGENIEIKILEIRGAQVKIGIKAPLSFQIERDNIKNKIPKERKEVFFDWEGLR